MYCIILSAGKNLRLDTGIPKSLLEIDGVSLLERHIRTFHQAGVDHFCIVTGHNPSRIRTIAPGLAEKYSVNIELVHNERYDLENGFSVSSGEEWVKRNDADSFFLTMGDHFFDPGFVECFLKSSKDSQYPLELAVDKPGQNNNHIDLDDVTKVLADADKNILQIGKEITEYNYFDTGLFRLKPNVFDILRACFEEGKYTISHMVQRLATSNNARALAITGYFWNDVDNPTDLKNTIGLIRNR